MKKLLSAVLAAALLLSTALIFSSCENGGGITIAIPNDTTNEARALLLLQAEGYIKLDEKAGIAATPKDIVENPYGIKFTEVEAAQLPNVLPDVDFAVINSNYAIPAGLDPTKDSLAIEGSYSAYSNVLSVKDGNQNTDWCKALVAALESKRVADYIKKTYGGAVISTVETAGDGFAKDVDYSLLKGKEIKVAASPTPHAEILTIAKNILSERGITLTVIEFTDYVQPNSVVESGEADANYFQHAPYMEAFNAEQGTHIVSAAAVHVEPMGLYGGRQKDLSVFAGK